MSFVRSLLLGYRLCSLCKICQPKSVIIGHVTNVLGGRFWLTLLVPTNHNDYLAGFKIYIFDVFLFSLFLFSNPQQYKIIIIIILGGEM